MYLTVFIAYVLLVFFILYLNFIIWYVKDANKIDYLIVRDHTALYGPSYAHMLGLGLGLVLYFILGCSSIVAYCLETGSVSNPNVPCSNIAVPCAEANDIVPTKFGTLEEQTAALSKLLGEKLYVVHLEFFGRLAYNPNSVDSFYGLDKNGLLRPHFYLYNSYLDEDNKLHRYSPSPIPHIPTEGERRSVKFFHIVINWVNHQPGSTALSNSDSTSSSNDLASSKVEPISSTTENSGPEPEWIPLAKPYLTAYGYFSIPHEYRAIYDADMARLPLEYQIAIKNEKNEYLDDLLTKIQDIQQTKIQQKYFPILFA